MAGATVTVGGAGTFGAGSLTPGPGYQGGGAGQAFANGIYLQGVEPTLTFAPSTGSVVTVAGVIGDDKGSASAAYAYGNLSAGSVGITDNGPGTLVLTGANTYSGGTTIAAGSTIQVGAGGTAGSIQGSVTDNGVLAFDRADAVSFSGLIAGAGELRQMGTGILILPTAQTYGGGTVIDAGGTLEIGAGADTGSIAGEVVDNGALDFDRADHLIFGNAIDGAGAVVQTSEGALTLAGANSYSGGTVIDGGVVELTSATTAGTGAIVFGANADAELEIDGTAAPTNSISLADATDLIDLANIGYAPGDHLAAAAGSKYFLETAANEAIAAITLSGSVNPAQLTLASDGAGGIEIGTLYTAAEAAQDSGALLAGSTRIAIDDSAANLEANASAVDALIDAGKVFAMISNGATFADNGGPLLQTFGSQNVIYAGVNDAVSMAFNEVLDMTGGGDVVSGFSNGDSLVVESGQINEQLAISGVTFGGTLAGGWGAGIWLRANALVFLNGNFDSVGLQADDALDLTGSDDVVIGDAPGAAIVVQSGSNFDALDVSGVDFGTTLTHGWLSGIWAYDDVGVTVSGNFDNIAVSAGDAVDIIGSDDTLDIASSGSSIVIESGDYNDALNLGGDAFGATAMGDWASGVFLRPQAMAIVKGGNTGIGVANDDVLDLTGDDDIVSGLAAGASIVLEAGDRGDTLSLSNAGLGELAFSAWSSGIWLRANVTTTVDGDYDGIGMIGGDTLTLTGADDTILSGPQGDNQITMTGTTDRFVFQRVFGDVSVTGFNSTDSMVFNHLDFAGWNALQGDMTQSGNDTLITLNPQNIVTLVGVTSVAQAQFTFE